MEYHGRTLEEAIHKSLRREHAIRKQKQAELEQKAMFDFLALPLIWGPWVEIWAQYGVRGPNADKHREIIDISFAIWSRKPSSFDIEIKGGDQFLRAVGPGTVRATVTGNVSTAISARVKSHSNRLHVVATV
jgi:hypothetical protein